MGRMSVSTEIIGLVFGSGMTLAIFHSLGITPLRNELLNMAVNGAARIFVTRTRILGQATGLPQ